MRASGRHDNQVFIQISHRAWLADERNRASSARHAGHGIAGLGWDLGDTGIRKVPFITATKRLESHIGAKGPAAHRAACTQWLSLKRQRRKMRWQGQ
jgi:hypothetical protein